MKETQLIKDYKKAVLSMKEFEQNNSEFRKLRDRILELHTDVFLPKNISKIEKTEQIEEMYSWLESIDFDYF